MTDAKVALRKLVERALADKGALPLELLLAHAVPVARLRALAQKFGISPKGGFRLERAPAHVLAPALAELREPQQLEQVCALLLPPATGGAATGAAGGGDGAAAPAGDAGAEPAAAAATPAPAPDPAAAEAKALAALREAELQRLRAELDRARESAARARDRETDLLRRLDQAERERLVLRRDLDRLAQAPAPASAGEPAGRGEPDRDLLRRVHDLEAEREGFLEADAALRRQRAHDQSRLRELEATVAELEALLPKGRRKPKAPPPPPPEERRFRLPYFAPGFHKSLVGKERKAVERAFQAILLFCTEGHSYPGLEVKQLGGQDTWSLRASLGLRVYFRQLPDGDVEFLEVADREDQHTTLRRLKDR